MSACAASATLRASLMLKESSGAGIPVVLPPGSLTGRDATREAQRRHRFASK